MRLGHSKKSSFDYDNFHKAIKTDRSSIRPFVMTTEGNEANPSLEPGSAFARYTLASHFPIRQKPKSRSPYLKTDEQRKSMSSTRKTPFYLKTEESGLNNTSDGLISKISQLKIEVKNYKEKEKRYQTKINELETDKEMLMSALEKLKKKFNDTAKENKEDKRKLNYLMESYKINDVDLSYGKVDQETQTVMTDNFFKELGNMKDMNSVVYKTKFSELLNFLYSKTQEIESHTNSMVVDNLKFRKEIKEYKKRNENLKTSSEYNKVQLKYTETVQNEIALQNKSLQAEAECFREYIKKLPNFGKSLNKGAKPPKVSQFCDKCNHPVPSYIKALSLTLC